MTRYEWNGEDLTITYTAHYGTFTDEDTRALNSLGVALFHVEAPDLPPFDAALAAFGDRFGGALDAGAGIVDGFADAINPLDFVASIPDIGPRFGNSGAYTGGYYGGLGAGVVGSFAVGNVAAGIGAGSKLTKLAQAYTIFDTGGGRNSSWRCRRQCGSRGELWSWRCSCFRSARRFQWSRWAQEAVRIARRDVQSPPTLLMR